MDQSTDGQNTSTSIKNSPPNKVTPTGVSAYKEDLTPTVKEAKISP